MKSFVLFALLLSIISCQNQEDEDVNACSLLSAMDLTLTINFINPPPDNFFLYINDEVQGVECSSNETGEHSRLTGEWIGDATYVAQLGGVFSNEEIGSEFVHISVRSVADCTDQSGTLIIDETETLLLWTEAYPNGEDCPSQDVATSEVNQ